MGFETTLEEEGRRCTHVLCRHFRYSCQHSALAGFSALCCFIKRKLGILRCLSMEYDRDLRRNHVVSHLASAVTIAPINRSPAPAFRHSVFSWSNSSPSLAALRHAAVNNTTITEAETSSKISVSHTNPTTPTLLYRVLETSPLRIKSKTASGSRCRTR